MKKKTSYLLFLFFSLLPAFCISQNSEIDSLLSIEKSSSNDTQKVAVYNRLSRIYCAFDLNTALGYNKRAIDIAQKEQLPDKLADAYNTRGIIFINQTKFKEADTSLNKAIELHIKTNNKKGIASGYGNLANMYFMIGAYNKSLEYNLKCLKINEEIGDKKGAAIALINIASIYSMQKNYTESIKYNNRCRAINRELHNANGELSALNNIGCALIDSKKYDQAISYFDTIKKVAESDLNNFQFEYGMALEGLGNALGHKNIYAKAHSYLEDAYKIYQKLNNNYKILDVTGNISNLYVKEGNFTKSVEYSMAFLELAKAAAAKPYERDAYEYLYKSYEGLKDYAKAFQYHQQFVSLNDSIFNTENLQNLNEVETKFETEKKESENKLLLQQNQIQQLQISRSNYFIGGILIVLAAVIIIAFLFIRQNKLNEQQRTMQLEQQLLRSQMNPHFIFNSLTAIESYIYKNEPKEAGRYLSAFARLMRLILENSREEYIPLSREIATLEYYLELQKNRFDDSFDYTIEVAENTDTESIAIPPMLAQPFIENSIEHGLKNMDKKGNIRVRFHLENDQLNFEVTDNGIGFEKSMAVKEQNNVHRSMATTITMERLSALNRKKRKKIRLAVDNVRDAAGNVSGTQVSFMIPFKKIYA